MSEEGVHMKDYTIRFKDCSIYYEMYDNKTKPTLVFLHGFTTDTTLFDSIIIMFKKDFQLLLVDMPGHGRSNVSKAVGFKDMPEILKSIFDQHEIENAHFMGVDMGAIVAQAFGHIYPNQIDSLISIGSHSIYHETNQKISREHRLTNIGLAFKWMFSFNRFLNHYAHLAAISDSGISKFKISQKRFKKHGLKAFKGLKRFYRWQQPTKVYPIYIICGEYEEEVIKDASIQFEQKVPNTILEGFNKSKHVVFLDQSRIFVEHVQTFLRTQSK